MCICFWSITSWNIENIICMYAATVWGMSMMLWLRHCWRDAEFEGIFYCITTCKSGNFVSAALSVKNNVRHCNWVIILVSLLLRCVQNGLVPRRCAPNLMAWSGRLSVGICCRCVCSSSIVVGVLCSWLCLINEN